VPGITGGASVSATQMAARAIGRVSRTEPSKLYSHLVTCLVGLSRRSQGVRMRRLDPTPRARHDNSANAPFEDAVLQQLPRCCEFSLLHRRFITSKPHPTRHHVPPCRSWATRLS